ncbi:Protein of unknown function (DUF3263) [Frankia sp. EI5c]|uniref:DUF3263 domain-containing protein n=1 Tax=Frankia sp. EI5c TaxID=683316 RepID=UPI0007C3C325|nr:DUF3263 domain-containing protein [Frankia sp. EI5c]OAA18204.1 Protein of unknown function (DUF3263) [Frankia sp. EI5c]
MDAARAGELNERDARILAFEKLRWRHPGAKDAAIRAEFGLSSTRYYQILNILIDSPAALAAEPMLVGRLLRLRDERRRARAGALDDAGAPGGDGPDD